MKYTQIGSTKKTHGVHGELKVLIEEHYEDLFFDLDRVFLDIRGSKQPFFIESIRGGGDLIVHFDDVPNRDDALLLQGRGIFILAEEVPDTLEIEIPDPGFHKIIGYLLVDRTAGQIGKVEEIIEMPQQEMALVRYEGKEVLIPLNEQFVVSVDELAQQILVDLPEGLLTL